MNGERKHVACVAKRDVHRTFSYDHPLKNSTQGKFQFQTAHTYTHAQTSTRTHLQRRPSPKKGLLDPLRERAVDPLDVMEEFRAHMREEVRETSQKIVKGNFLRMELINMCELGKCDADRQLSRLFAKRCFASRTKLFYILSPRTHPLTHSLTVYRYR